MFEGPDARARGPKRRLYQFLVAAAASMSGLAAGMALVFERFAFEILQEADDEKMPLARATIVQLLITVTAGALTGALSSGGIAHYYGRRPAIILVALEFILSCVLLYFSYELTMLFAARFIAGLGIGGTFAIVPVYVSEVADDSVRASLGSMLQMSFYTGVVIISISSTAHYFELINLCCLLVAIVVLASAVWMPETPHFLFAKGRLKDAERSLSWLRGKHCKWLKQMEEAKSEGCTSCKLSWKCVLTNRSTNKALGIALGLVVLQQLSEVRDRAFNEITIFREAGLHLPASITSMIFEWTSLVSTLVAMLMVDRARRKLLLLVSTLAMAACLLTMSALLLAREQETHAQLSWLPVVCAVVYTIMYDLGLGPLPYVITAELLPPAAKSVASAVVSCVSLLCSRAAPELYGYIYRTVGESVADLFFGMICILCAVYVVCFVPETRGKSLAEIQAGLSGIVMQETTV